MEHSFITCMLLLTATSIFSLVLVALPLALFNECATEGLSVYYIPLLPCGITCFSAYYSSDRVIS